MNQLIMKQLFQYAVVVHKYTTDANGGKTYSDAEIIIHPTTILAKDTKDVVFKVTRLIPEEHANEPDNVQILVRNF